MKKLSFRTVTHLALLVALQIVLTRFLSISTPILRISLGFVPIAIAGMLFGPLSGGLVAATADFLGAILFPIGAYFPGFTLTAFLTGVVYGLFLFQKEKSWLRIISSVLVIAIVLNLGMNTFWIMVITGKGYLALLPARLMQNIIMIPLQAIVVKALSTKEVRSLFMREHTI
jgi:ECF transporter S component (folate family)